MSSVEPAEAENAPIVIYRSVNRDGATFALAPGSLARLRQRFGGAVRAHPRIFIAHETRDDYKHLNASIVPQIVSLLTGLSVDHLKSLGGVTFRDPVTDRDLAPRKL